MTFADTIYYGKNNSKNLNADVIKTLNHEYGHTVQFDKLGPAYFIKEIGIPSIVGYNMDKKNDMGYYYYTDQPWENGADK